MPVYQYTCRDCGTPLEVHQEFSDAALTECPVCGGRLRKQYGSIGVTFNGSGFYRNDSRAGSGEGGSTGSGSGDGGSKESSSGSGAKGGSGDGGSSAPKTESAKPAASASTSSSSGGSTAS